MQPVSVRVSCWLEWCEWFVWLVRVWLCIDVWLDVLLLAAGQVTAWQHRVCLCLSLSPVRVVVTLFMCSQTISHSLVLLLQQGVLRSTVRVFLPVNPACPLGARNLRSTPGYGSLFQPLKSHRNPKKPPRKPVFFLD